MNSALFRSCSVRLSWRPLLFLSIAALAEQPQSVTVDELTISAAWAHAPAPDATSATAYLSIENKGRQLDTLLRAETAVASEVTFQRTTVRGGISRTDPVWSVDLPPGRTLKFDPIGRQLLLSGLKQPLTAGSRFPLTLHFQHAGAVSLQVEVVAPTASGPPTPTGPSNNRP